ncbi:hypothetical protein [Sulfurisoma sediminicola]|uniref:Uncharacterized protein n=1 Tax=Sulfurisoma sediminicola TaxID=1381557 RepID=A0A497XEJ6_9PROT|nr:hypothetical protein [Sulfurisoma sediminicola]RLJ65129.1 hypothetical protein DFR35_1785 [Sulfurisoma sediminicola]
MKRTHSLTRWSAILLLALLAACQTNAPKAEPPKDAVQQRVQDGKTLWEEKCRTVAGEKIYRKVEGVEGVLLMKVRPRAGEREWADRNWPGAAFARELHSDSYITSFLGFEEALGTDGKPRAITPDRRGYITTTRNPGGLPGYRWVEVIDEKDGQRFRYTGSEKVVGRKDVNAPNVKIELERNPNYDLNVYRYTLDKAPSISPPPRYGVTYEDHVIPEERYLGIASSTIKVIDLKTNEVLGEMTRYAWSPGAPSRVNPSPWLTAYRCPEHAVGTDQYTRKFVDQILIPAKEK